MLAFGNAGGEAQWFQDPDTGMMELQGLRDAAIPDMRPMQLRGQLAGLEILGNHHVFAPRFWWITNDPLYGSFYGQSRLEPAWHPFSDKAGKHGALGCRRLWYLKNAYRGGRMRHPVGRFKDTDGEIKDYEQKARQIVELYETGGVLTQPNTRDENGNYMWEFEDPTINGELRDLREYPKDLDREILIGLGIPPEVVDAAESGSGWSGRSVPFLVFLSGEDEIASNMVHSIDRQLIRYGARFNFGSAAKYEIKVHSLIQAEEKNVTQPSAAAWMAGRQPGIMDTTSCSQPL
jgi:hypothetical protein